ncbi:MAG: type II secretion system protein M [Gammaproteobacteria bacterium]|nr:type II secretion system protein M [Gammaproteobacteria bacterium]
MTDSIAQIKQKWRGLQPRERTIILVGSVILAVFFVYAGVWIPVAGKIQALSTTLPKKQAQLALMQTQARTIKLATSNSGAKPEGTVMARIEAISRQRNLASLIDTMEPQGNDGVRLVISSISFDQLIDLIDAANRQSLMTSSASLDATENIGTVSARMVFKEQ